jgi:hypothetical protein
VTAFRFCLQESFYRMGYFRPLFSIKFTNFTWLACLKVTSLDKHHFLALVPGDQAREAVRVVRCREVGTDDSKRICKRWGTV